MLSRCNAIIFAGLLGSAALGNTPAEATSTANLEFVSAKSSGFEFTYRRPSVYPPMITSNGVAQCERHPTSTS